MNIFVVKSLHTSLIRLFSSCEDLDVEILEGHKWHVATFFTIEGMTIYIHSLILHLSLFVHLYLLVCTALLSAVR